MSAMETISIAWLELYKEIRQPGATFLQSFFKFGPKNIHNAGTLKFDIVRRGKAIAIPIRHYAGGNLNKMTEFKGVEITPPKYLEGFAITGEMLLKRMAGKTPEEMDDIEYSSILSDIMIEHFAECDAMIVGALELQAAQLLQTGKLDLKDTAGTGDVYAFDFLPKVTHFANVGTVWSNTASTPIADIEDQLEITARDGKCVPDIVMFGKTAWKNFINHAGVQAKLDILRLDIGMIAPIERNAMGANWMGRFLLNGFSVDFYTYREYYESPADSSVQVDYLGATKVVILDSRAVFTKESCRVPFVATRDPRATAMIPGRISDAASGIDFTPNVAIANDAKSAIADLEARVVLIPKQIDAISCLTTE